MRALQVGHGTGRAALLNGVTWPGTHIPGTRRSSLMRFWKVYRSFRRGAGTFRGAARYLAHRRHQLICGRLLDRVSGSGNSVKPALRNVGIQPSRLRVDVDQLSCSANDDDRHLKIRIPNWTNFRNVALGRNSAHFFSV